MLVHPSFSNDWGQLKGAPREKGISEGCTPMISHNLVSMIVFVVSALAWCGAMYGYVLFLRQLRASGHSIWTWNQRARFAAWRGRPIRVFAICGVIFAGVIWASLKFR
jgi:hypothetical protein